MNNSQNTKQTSEERIKFLEREKEIGDEYYAYCKKFCKVHKPDKKNR